MAAKGSKKKSAAPAASAEDVAQATSSGASGDASAATTPPWIDQRSLIALLILGVVTIGLGMAAWQSLGPIVIRDRQFLVAPNEIELTPPPEWIKSDVRGEVIRQAGISEALSILDPGLTERLARDFSLHPWIGKVVSVRTEHPARIYVDVVYRQPVLMVEVPGGLYPVDGRGVLVPSGDFSPIEATRYPRLGGVQSTPGLVGAAWPDRIVTDAAELGAILLASWPELKLHRIVPLTPDVLAAPDAPAQFALVTPSGRTRILWGLAPGSAASDEPTGEEKLARLKKLISTRQPLELAVPQEFDLREVTPIQVPPTAAETDGEMRLR